MKARTAALVAAGAWLSLRAFRWATQESLHGKSVLVTGGSRGLGLVLARELLKEGARVAICGRDEDEVARAFLDLCPRGGHVLALKCDVTHPDQVETLIRVVEERFGGLDVLINNAGVISVGPVETMNLGDYAEAMRTHFWAPLYTTLAALPGMRRRGGGRIVNIASIGGMVSVPHLLPYDASKFALVGLSEGLRAELKKDNIVVTTVCPGLMRTGSPCNADFKGQHRLEYTWFSLGDSIPLFTISAEGAARQIIRACKRGDAEIVLTFPAKAAVLFHGLFPGLTADILALVNQFLPAPGGIGQQRAKGKESTSSLSPSPLTTLTERAALRNNEVPPEERLADFNEGASGSLVATQGLKKKRPPLG
jgi:NAD(P)-dependent dehydrogenase (short-subunit alcohol dehydrogenase family)